MHALRRILWSALRRAEAVPSSPDDATTIRLLHALAQTSAVYLKLLETIDLERRVSQLEEVVRRRDEP